MLTPSTLSGQLDFQAESVSNASAYEGQMTTDINKDEWENVGTFPAPRFSLDDLKPGALPRGRFGGTGGVE